MPGAVLGMNSQSPHPSDTQFSHSSGKSLVVKIILLLPLALLVTGLSIADEANSDRTRIEFFEKLYDIKIEGIEPIEQYDDPDSFYSAIARQVGIPRKAFEAVNKKLNWKQDDDFFLSAMIKGGPVGDYWRVLVTKFPTALKKAKTNEEKLKLLQKMEMKMVLIGYDGIVSFPEENKKNKKEGK
jgi:hypothetical protein